LTTASNGDRGVYKGYAVQRSTTDIPPVVKTVTTNITNYNYVPPPPVVTPPSGGGGVIIVGGWTKTVVATDYRPSARGMKNGVPFKYSKTSGTALSNGWSVGGLYGGTVCGPCGECATTAVFSRNKKATLCGTLVILYDSISTTSRKKFYNWGSKITISAK